MNKLGMHIHGMKPGIIQAVKLLQPRAVTLMDPEPKDLRAVHDASPETFIAMRKYEDGRGWQETDPFEWAEQCYDMSQGLANGIVAWNEPFGHDDRGSCAPFDEWTYAFWSACRQLGSMEAVVLCMATGNWTGAADRYRITDDFPLTCANAKFFGPHEYCWPTLEIGVPWYTLRYQAWAEDLEAIRQDDFSFIISEAGLTQAIIYGRDDVGWRSGGPEGVTEDSYIATLDWYNAKLCEDWRVLGCCLYDYAGQWYGWPTFEQLGLEHWIYQIQAPEPPEPPEPPEEDPMVEIYDYDSKLRDWNWLRAEFGDVRVRPVEEKFSVREGERIYKVCYLRAKSGDSSCQINVKDLDGQNIVRETVVFGWADAEPHGLIDNGHNWSGNGVKGLTNETGDVGPGMGEFYSPADGECGPYWCWVYGRPSDYVDGLGMLAMTYHDHLDVGYCEVIAREGEPPEPPVDGNLLDEVKEIRLLVAEIRNILIEEPPDEPDPPEPPGPEIFHVEFFNNEDLTGPPVYTMTEAPPFWHDWGSGSPAPGVNEDHVSGRWSGSFTFDETKTYRFNVKTDDGVRLWVDGEMILDKWYPQSATLYFVEVPLTAGLHKVVLEWYEDRGHATLHFNWE